MFEPKAISLRIEICTDKKADCTDEVVVLSFEMLVFRVILTEIYLNSFLVTSSLFKLK